MGSRESSIREKETIEFSVMIISILICSLHSRASLLRILRDHLDSQIGNKTDLVQVLDNCDDKQSSTGTKRNQLVDSAKGKYIIFIDDDDWVPDYYVSELLKASESNADCFAINGIMTTDGAQEVKWKLSKDNDNVTIWQGKKYIYLRKTNHITAVKRELALLAPFPDKSNAEDKAYSDAVNKYLKTEYVIEKPMYHYRFSTKNKQYK